MRTSELRRARLGAVASIALVAAVIGLTGCASHAEPAADAAPHGFVDGATEAPEPQLALAELDSDGTIMLRDLLTGESSEIATLESATSSVTTDGRFVFASSADSGSVTIVDTGLWTVDHGDHFHYYRSEARVVGELTGAGEPIVHPGQVLTTVRFPDSGDVTVLDGDALRAGEITEVATLDDAEAEVVPVGEFLLVAAPDGVTRLVSPDAPGDQLATAACGDPLGSIRTRVGVVIGCAEGALLAPVDSTSGEVTLELIPYPDGTTGELRAESFDGRLGRPTVAAVAGSAGLWLLDTRERTWQLVPTDVPLLQVAAVDNADGHVVALADDGRVLAFDSTGALTGATAPLLDTTLGTPAAAGVELTVDAQRAYLNAPGDHVIYEIDYADAARIARTFPADADFFAETGR